MMYKLVLLAGAFATIAATTALPTGAATPTSFTLTAGALSISAPTGSVSLGSQVASTSSDEEGGLKGAPDPLIGIGLVAVQPRSARNRPPERG